jgi:hypothetical protein
LRSCVRLLPAADTLAARLPSTLKALPLRDTCGQQQHPQHPNQNNNLHHKSIHAAPARPAEKQRNEGQDLLRTSNQQLCSNQKRDRSAGVQQSDRC